MSASRLWVNMLLKLRVVVWFELFVWIPLPVAVDTVGIRQTKWLCKHGQLIQTTPPLTTQLIFQKKK